MLRKEWLTEPRAESCRSKRQLKMERMVPRARSSRLWVIARYKKPVLGKCVKNKPCISFRTFWYFPGSLSLAFWVLRCWLILPYLSHGWNCPSVITLFYLWSLDASIASICPDTWLRLAGCVAYDLSSVSVQGCPMYHASHSRTGAALVHTPSALAQCLQVGDDDGW